MSQSDVANAARGYELLSQGYRSGDLEGFRRHVHETAGPDFVFVPAGVLPDSTGSWAGPDGFMQFVEQQMLAFEDGSMWLESLEYIDSGDRVIVPYRFGGRAKHTGIDIEFSFVHVFTQRHGKTVRLDVYKTKDEAFADLGITDRNDA